MPSDRITKRIEILLDQAEEALAENQWDIVEARCRAVLALDPANADATEYIAAVERAVQSSMKTTTNVLSDVLKNSTVSPDSVASGRYLISKFLGEGGKKKVYLAHDTTLDIDVALAQIKTEDLDNIGRERIKREAQAMARLGTDPHIVPIFDLIEEDGRPYMVQPLMSGGDVEALIEDADGPLDLDRALEISIQTAKGLAFAHSRGIIHRDIKPGNVWLDENGLAKIGDFGLSVATERSRITVEKVMVGTVSYMPPEQATGAELTPLADIYSLGAMLYEMCTGRVPFVGDDDIGVISQHINTPPVAPSWHNKLIPQALNSLIMRMLAKDPSERPETAREVVSALGSIDLSAVIDQSDDTIGHSLDGMAGGVFVGRQREMDQLKASFEEVLSGKGRMITIVGEPGVGKSRTAQEFATYGAMRGARVIWGMSYEGGGEPPYWPWVKALRQLVSDLEPVALRAQLGAVAPVLADLVADIRVVLPDLPEPTHIEDPESARFMLMDSVTTFLKNTAQSRPLVLMLEDMHWSDRPSLRLLEFVARELDNSRLMIIGNYRDMELSRRHPLAITLGELGRERRFERVLLRGLQRHDIQRFIEIAAGIDPPPPLVDAVHAQTEGNPLFVTETVRLLIQEGTIKANQALRAGSTAWEIRIPEGVRQVIGRRLDRLSERCNEILTTAAITGRQFRFPVLLALVDDATENTLLDALDEALAGRIIEELPGEVGLYQFTHALMQETLASELSANRIVRMHGRIALALEQYYGDTVEEHASELCEHFAEAETVLGPAKLVRYALLAGQQALSTFAWDEALIHFQRAMGAKESIETASAAGVLDDEALLIVRQLHQIQVALLQSGEAELSLKRLYEHYVSRGQISAAVNALIESPSPSPELIEAALKLVNEDSHEAGKLLAWHGRQLGMRGNYDDAEMAFYNAMAIAQREDDQALALRVMINSNQVDLVTQQYGPEAVEKGRRYIEIAQKAGDKFVEAEAQIQTAWNALYIGDPKTAQFHADAYQQLANELRLRIIRRLSMGVSSSIAQSIGDFKSARELAKQGIELEDHHQLNARLIDLDLEQGHIKDAQDRIANLIGITRFQTIQDDGDVAAQETGVFTRTMAKALRCGAEIETARDVLDELNAGTWDGQEIGVNPNHTMGHLLLKVHFGETEGLEELVASLESIKYIFLAPVAHVAHIMALGLTCLGKNQQAKQLFEEAIEFCRNAGYKPELAWTLADYVEMLLKNPGTETRNAAWELQSEAMDIATALRMTPLVKRLVSTRGHRSA